MLKKVLNKAFTKTMPPKTQQVISRTDPKTGQKQALFVKSGIPVKSGLPSERFWPGRDVK